VEAIRRKAARYRVHLQVRYAVAADFVREYAENLSRGGLFVRGASGLARRRDVEVEVELPGLGSYRVHAEVMHVIDEAEAQGHGRTPGAGLAIVDAPDGFAAALETYLGRLGRRGDARVLVAGDEAARLLAAAGYQVDRLDAPRSPTESGRIPAPRFDALALVVPTAERTAAEAMAPALPVVCMDRAAELDRVLEALDARL
jgi:uncharacterized protein (TIGR02266 family)